MFHIKSLITFYLLKFEGHFKPPIIFLLINFYNQIYSFYLLFTVIFWFKFIKVKQNVLFYFNLFHFKTYYKIRRHYIIICLTFLNNFVFIKFVLKICIYYSCILIINYLHTIMKVFFSLTIILLKHKVWRSFVSLIFDLSEFLYQTLLKMYAFFVDIF